MPARYSRPPAPAPRQGLPAIRRPGSPAAAAPDSLSPFSRMPPCIRFTPVARTPTALTATIRGVPGVYLSYPFCAQKCTYCNFASGVFPRDMEAKYLAALRAEIGRLQFPWTPETIYLGGGTPSAMEPEALAAVLAPIPGRPWL